MAMAEAEGAFGKMLEGTRRQWVVIFATFSPDDLNVVRQELSRYGSGCDFQRMPTLESPTIAAAPQLVLGDSSDDLPVGGGLANSDARRQWVSMSATLSPDDLSVVRQEISRYDSGCDFQRMPTSESPTVSAAPRLVYEGTRRQETRSTRRLKDGDVDTYTHTHTHTHTYIH